MAAFDFDFKIILLEFCNLCNIVGTTIGANSYVHVDNVSVCNMGDMNAAQAGLHTHAAHIL